MGLAATTRYCRLRDLLPLSWRQSCVKRTPPPSAVSWLYCGTMMAHTGVPLNGTLGPRQEGNSLSVKDQALQASENLSVRYWFLQDPTQR